MPRSPDILSRFGTRLRELRKKKGFSQEALAAICELDRTYVSGIERGERNVALRNIERLAIGLGTTTGELLRGL